MGKSTVVSITNASLPECRRGQPQDVQSIPVTDGSFWGKAGAVCRCPDAAERTV